jgi:hypothetical protein
MTRYHRKWDRRGRLLNAVQRLLASVIVASDISVAEFDRPRSPYAERLYVRTVKMQRRIKKELSNG